jgi:tetratricopeptide (TPR) repeat protein
MSSLSKPSLSSKHIIPPPSSAHYHISIEPSSSPLLPSSDPNFDAEAELLFLDKIDRKCLSLQRKGQIMYAIELMESGLSSRKLLYGDNSPPVLQCAEKLIILYNSLAMSSLYKEEYKLSLKLLRKAERLSLELSSLLAVRIQTLNNLACVYRRLDRPKTALNLLRESIALLATQDENELEGRETTHLNMCAILSQLSRHSEAIQHAKAAVLNAQKGLLSQELKQKLENTPQQAEQAQILTEKIVILAIAYHNLGVECEYLGEAEKCLEWYKKAKQLAQEHIGQNEQITLTFNESYVQAKKVAAEKRRLGLTNLNANNTSSNSSSSSIRPQSAGSSRSRTNNFNAISSNNNISQLKSSSLSRPSSAASIRSTSRGVKLGNRQPLYSHTASSTGKLSVANLRG